MPAYKDSNGKWYCKFYFTDWNGEKKQKKKSGFNTQREAKSWERNFLESKKTDSTITINTLCDKFIEVKRHELKPATMSGYNLSVNRYIKPMLGMIKANELTPLQVKEFHTRLLQKIKTSSVNLTHRHLSAILNFGMKFYGIQQNPCKVVGKLKCDKPKINFITLKEFELLKNHIDPEYELFFYMLFWTGMRISEARALTPADITDRKIVINKNLVNVKGTHILQESPKTSNSIRIIDIHENLYQHLQNHINRMYDKESLIFPYLDSTYRNALERACRSAGLRHLRVHDMRHSHVSMLIHMGVSPNAIAERIGDTVNTVMVVYAHVYDVDKKDIVTKLQDVEENEKTCF